MADVSVGSVFVIIFCVTLVGLVTTTMSSPTTQQQIDEINEKLKYGYKTSKQ